MSRNKYKYIDKRKKRFGNITPAIREKLRIKEEALTHEYLLRVLHYEPETGLFYWKEHERWSLIGEIAGKPTGQGYIRIKIAGIDYHKSYAYQAHRLAWFYIHKRWPVDQIDHKNRIKDDNRICNLRECTTEQNMLNVVPKNPPKSGYRGVKELGPNQWRAMLGKRLLGIFPTKDKAIIARLEAEQEYYGDNEFFPHQS